MEHFLSHIWIYIGIAAFLAFCFFCKEIVGGFLGLYRIVPVNETHIRIMNNSKQTFSARTGKSAYWVIPFVTKLQKLPLSNISITTDNIKLNDNEMAKFTCDIVCFVNITDIDLAVERLVLTPVSHAVGFDVNALSADLRAIMESIGRTVSTKQSILEIYMDRKKLVDAITKEVQDVFPKWGITLVNLELKHIKDADGSTIIADIERQRAAEIRRDADIKVAQTEREAKIVQASTEEEYRKRQIQKDQAIAIAEQEQQIAVQIKTQEANLKEIEALRKLDVGKAEIAKQITEQNAMGQKIKVEQEAEAQRIKYQTEAEGKAKEIISVGQATADMIRAKLVAEAEGNLKLAEAMKAVQESAIEVKKLEINRDIQIARFKAFADSLSKAEIKWIMSGSNANNFFGMNLNAEGGANLEQFIDQLNLGPDVVTKIKGLITAAKTA